MMFGRIELDLDLDRDPLSLSLSFYRLYRYDIS